MTPNGQTIVTVNAMGAEVRRLVDVLANIQTLANSYVELNMSEILKAMPTAPLLPDGSLGTQDPAPVAGNPIDTRTVSELEISLSSYDCGVMLNLLQELTNLLNGAVVTQQQYARSVLAKATLS